MKAVLRVHVCAHVLACLRVCVCMHVHACVCVYMHACVHVCISVYHQSCPQEDNNYFLKHHNKWALIHTFIFFLKIDLQPGKSGPCALWAASGPLMGSQRTGGPMAWAPGGICYCWSEGPGDVLARLFSQCPSGFCLTQLAPALGAAPRPGCHSPAALGMPQTKPWWRPQLSPTCWDSCRGALDRGQEGG